MKKLFSFILFSIIFLFFIWYIIQCGICQNKAKINNTYKINKTEYDCLFIKNWK